MGSGKSPDLGLSIRMTSKPTYNCDENYACLLHVSGLIKHKQVMAVIMNAYTEQCTNEWYNITGNKYLLAQ